ncbi:MAG: class I SAM-dependent methyltransferase [Zetaproteobacteria bacterium CG12_big_fil_rev_8_21_14_0_65_54_13]|nr:MAG: class I SAM-dependent methyltransferase [Zetaproteobacteria bacterium CG12_big_fil_rev_8_21_14_0_65_54_13]PIX55085.1 MAG: class I SAM-dependent methyltransferase [Zetaproteobacteria bacterium CG_4_10_14_3_um_filter_54_28]PJA30197.1 MAG: class I SAM-dependent methyltransferase [Zetaproteobacteria bacterium CG_4_9_14_3_um_filter_54_145]
MKPDYKSVYYDYQTKARGLLAKESLTARFEQLARWYDGRLSPHLPKDKQARCLDVPCGFGNFLYFLNGKGYQNIQGIDLDSKQVELAKLVGLPAEQGDAFQILSGEGASFDLVTSLDFIEHLDKDKVLEFLSLIYNGLKPGGTIILRAPCGDGPFGAHDAWNDLTHQWGMTSNVVRTLLEMHGFENVKILDERPQPGSIVDTVRWLVFFPAKMIADGFCMALGMRPPAIWTRSMIAIGHKPTTAK